jgi:adenine phosphoribosyltransferase
VSTIDHVAGIEAIGFMLGMSISMTLSKGFIPLRKGGKLPVDAHSVLYNDYSRTEKTLELSRTAIKPGQRILLVSSRCMSYCTLYTTLPDTITMCIGR